MIPAISRFICSTLTALCWTPPQDICGAVQQVLDTTDCNPVTFDYLKSFIGRHLSTCFPKSSRLRCRAHREPDRDVPQPVPRPRPHVDPVYPGVAEGLANLGGRKGTATTKGTPTTRLVLEQFGLLPYFDHVQGTDGFPSKPAPDVIFKALEAMGARPEDCLFVGDSCADMEAGKRAGVQDLRRPLRLRASRSPRPIHPRLLDLRPSRTGRCRSPSTIDCYHRILEVIMAEELNRRNFLKSAALAAGPAIISARGANDKINIGWIGVGTRGYAALDWLHTAAANNVQITAICDTYQGYIARAHGPDADGLGHQAEDATSITRNCSPTSPSTRSTS